MATPAFLRYLPARLKPLSSPLIWGPLTVFCLLSVFVWEYRRNPDWSNRQPITNLDAEADSADLSPEEQASLSEIDTLDVLLESARLSGGNAALEVPASSSSEDDSRQLTDPTNPFYTREYEFPGTSAATSGRSTQPAISSPRGLSGSSLDSILPEPPSPAASSALSDALDRQQSAQSVPSGRSLNNGVDERNQGVSDAFGNQDIQPNQAVGPQPVGSPGSIPAPYIRTTPNMSPPVGTTGYRPPATSTLPVFNQPLPQPSRNPYSAAPAPAAQPAPLPEAAPQPGVSYTPPSFTQPDQTRRVR